MSKSKYSKVKAAGLLCGMSRCRDYKFRQAGTYRELQTDNRQIRRMRNKK